MAERLNPFDSRHVARVTMRQPPGWQTWAMLLDLSNRLRVLASRGGDTIERACYACGETNRHPRSADVDTLRCTACGHHKFFTCYARGIL